MKTWDEVNPRPSDGYAMVYDPKEKNPFERWSEEMMTESDINGAKFLGTEMVDGNHMHVFRTKDGVKFAQMTHMTRNGGDRGAKLRDGYAYALRLSDSDDWRNSSDEDWYQEMLTHDDPALKARFIGTRRIDGSPVNVFANTVSDIRSRPGVKTTYYYAQLANMTANGGMDEFTRMFLETALWSSNDESDESGGLPMDENYSIEDFDPKSVKGLEVDCKRFQEENATALADFDDADNGHNFWLNRNGHGAGFWDGDYPEPQATILDEASKKFGEVNLYVGDDGMIYASGYEKGKPPKHTSYQRNAEQLGLRGVSTERSDGKFDMPMVEFDWEQIDGDTNLAGQGGIIGRSDGGQIDLVEIQPVREYVDDREAAEVGYPFWIKEASYDASDLDPSNKVVKAALESSDVDLAEIEPEWRARAIALACMRYGHGSEEAGGGWAGDKESDEVGESNLLGSRKVRWGYAGVERKTFAEEAGDEDDEFRREILGEEDEED